MDKSDYALIGFSCASSVRELRRYFQGVHTNHLVFEDAYKITERLGNIVSKKGEFHMGDKDELKYLKLILGEPGEEKRIIELIPRIEATNSLLNKVLNDNKITEREMQEGIDFFEEISKRCRNYIDKPSCH